MRRIFLYMVMTLDGYLAGLNDELDWFHVPEERELLDDIINILLPADTWIMGYPTAPGMISYWLAVPGNPSASYTDRAIAKVVNQFHTVVLSNTEVELNLDNSELVTVQNDRDLLDATVELKGRMGKDIYIPGGVRTAQKFARLGLVDEYILFVQPIAIGGGKPLFTSRVSLALSFAKTYQSGVVQLRYQPRQQK